MNKNSLRSPWRSATTLSRLMFLIVLLPRFFFAEVPEVPEVHGFYGPGVYGRNGERQANQSLEELLSRLASGDEEQRVDAITQISAFWREAVDSVELPIVSALLKALQQDSSPVVRALAARALESGAENQVAGQGASQGVNKIVDALMAALGKEREVAVRKAIIYALARYPQPQVTAGLIPFLKHKRSELRASAAYALAEHRDPASAAALTEALKRRGKEKDAFVRSQAARGLGRIGGRDSINPLLDALRRDNSQEVCREAARALGLLAGRQDAKVIEALRAATLSNDPYLVVVAENAISAINSRNP